MDKGYMKDYSLLFWIMGVILAIMAFFVINASIKPEMAFISGIFIIALSLPAYFASIKWLGWKIGLFFIIIMSIYAVSIETFAIITGFPYSEFVYTDLIGFKVFGYTPYTVPFAYVPLFIGSIYLAALKSRNYIEMSLFAAVFVLFADLVLDPAAVALNFWIYKIQGIYYGIPLMNFFGWILTGFLAAIISVVLLKSKLFDHNKPKALISSLFLILCFWTPSCFYLKLWIPGIIGVVLLIYILNESKGRIGNYSN
jgi:putative membrane protein